MERSVSVSCDRNIRDDLWRWSTYFGRNIPTEIIRFIFVKPVHPPRGGGGGGGGARELFIALLLFTYVGNLEKE